jgi:hypothetical protein
MEQQETPYLDSVPPMTAPALPLTLPPKPRSSRRHLLIISTTFLQGTGLFSGLLTYWLLLDPILENYRLFGALLVGCTFLFNASSLITHVLLYQEIRSRTRR